MERKAVTSTSDKLVWTILGFFTPIGVLVIINLGIILNLPNQVQAFDGVVLWLSRSTVHENTVDVLVGLATIFVVFFSIQQFAYSLKHIPANLVRPYFLWHPKTMAFISFNVSASVIAGVFSIQPEISQLNWVYLLVLILFSLIVLLLYFDWFITAVSLEGAVRVIMSSIDLEKIARFDKELNERLFVFNESIKSDPRFAYGGWRGLLGRDPSVISSRDGIVTDINFKKLLDLFRDKMNLVEKVEIHAKIGQFIPKSPTVLLTAMPKASAFNEENQSQINYLQESSIFLNQNSKKIEQCFDIDSRRLKKLREPFNDVLDLYNHVASESPTNVDKVADGLGSFLRSGQLKSFEAVKVEHGGISVGGRIIRELVDELDNRAEMDLNGVCAQSMISLVYSLRDFALSKKDPDLIDALLRLLNRIFLRDLRRRGYYNPRIATQLLYIKEVSGLSAALSIQIEGESSPMDYWDNFYSPLINFSIQRAMQTMYNLVTSSCALPEEELRTYLMHNTDHLLGFLDSVQHWKKISSEKKEFIYSIYSRELMYLSIFMFRRYYYREQLAPEMVRDIGFVIAMYSSVASRSAWGREGANFDSRFFDPMFLRDPGFQYYDEPDLVTTATHVGSIPDISFFWVAFGLYLKSKRKQFIPTTIPADPKSLNDILAIRSALERIQIDKLLPLIGLKREEVETLISEYKSHLNA